MPPWQGVSRGYWAANAKGMRGSAIGRIITAELLMREAEMNARTLSLALTGAVVSATALAADGLLPPAADALWPQWQARVAVQTAGSLPLTLSGLHDGSAAPRGLQGGSVLGDYYFATPWFGSFRASGGLLVGSQAGAPAASAMAGSRLSLALNSSSVPLLAPGADGPGTVTYLGLGYSSPIGRSSLAVTADVGMVTEHLGTGRALFGNQARDSALRELRVSPLLQLGVRYTF